MIRKLKNEELGRLSVDEFRSSDKSPFVVVLDNIRSMHNVGSVFRTSDAFAVNAIYLCGITGRPPHREIEKTALGATLSVAWHYAADTKNAISELREAGYHILAIEQVAESVSLSEFQPEPGKKYALVFGNEVDGVDAEVIALCDACVEIPQFGTKHSFNITVSAGIVLWDLHTKITQR
jgi:23S rRNA (guanosine2251-2'-O)-methyltransferase